MSDDAIPACTRAESCVIACADVWREARRGHGQPLRHHSRPRRPAGQAHLLARPRADRRRGRAHGRRAAHRHPPGRAGARGGHAVPHRLRRGVVGPAPHDDDGEPDRPHRQPEHLGHRPARQAQGAAGRRARRAGQLGQPPHQLLGARPHRAHLRRAGRRGLRRGLRPGRRGRRRRHALPRHPPRRLQPGRVRLRDARPHHAAALVPPRRDRRRHRGGHRVRADHPRRRGRDPPARRPRSSSSSASCSTRARCATARCGPERRRRRRALGRAVAPGAPHRAVRAHRRALPAGADRHGLGGRAPPGGRHRRGRRAGDPGLGHHDPRRAGRRPSPRCASAPTAPSA